MQGTLPLLMRFGGSREEAFVEHAFSFPKPPYCGNTKALFLAVSILVLVFRVALL
jgi:hypothetical protein